MRIASPARRHVARLLALGAVAAALAAGAVTPHARASHAFPPATPATTANAAAAPIDGGAATVIDGVAAALDDNAAARTLAQRYAPIVAVQTATSLCDPDGEHYLPMPVERLLGHPTVALRTIGRGDPVIAWGPSAADLDGRSSAFYLDLPGDALQPECVYAEESAALNAGKPSTVYARVVTEDGAPGLLVLQYWLFYYFNDWNNKHEGDVEFVQLVFPARTAAEALNVEPLEAGYAQHEGGERADWSGDKIERDGTHPVIYPSRGSHASYFSRNVFLGRSSSTGFGCDTTAGDVTEIRPEIIMLPPDAASASGDLAWLRFGGRLGERQQAVNNGPTGPVSKSRWLQPISWQADLRETSFVIPGETAAGSTVVRLFCQAVDAGSAAYIAFQASPGTVLAIVAAAAIALLLITRRTTWTRVMARPLAQRRQVGQAVRGAFTLVRTHPHEMLGSGAVVIPVVAGFAALSAVLKHLPIVGGLVQMGDDDVLLSTMIGVVQSALLLAVASAALTIWLAGTDDGWSGVRRAWTVTGRRSGSILLAAVLAAVVSGLLSAVVVLVPAAVWLLIRWALTGPVIGNQGPGALAAMSASSRLVRKRWVRTAVLVLGIEVAVNAVGLLASLIALIALPGLPLWSLTLIGGVATALVTPIGAAALALWYGNCVTLPDAAAELVEPDVAAAMV